MATPIATLPSASDAVAVGGRARLGDSLGPAPGFVLLANPDSPRLMGWQDALARLGRPPAKLIAYADWLSGCVELDAVIRAGDMVRLESPGRDWEVERALLELGADAPDEGGDFERLSRREVRALEFEKGRLLASRQWFLGWRTALARAEAELAGCAPHCLLNAPSEIAQMFDKPDCHGRLQRAGVAVPRSLGTPRDFDDLIARMQTVDCRRVFVKLAHGSSAAGIVALRTDGTRWQAATTVEREGAALYNSRRICVHRDLATLAGLIDALCRHRVHVEEWIPKAGFAGQTFDLRVVVIGGRARHVVVRQSRTPMTNLHLLNTRGDLEALRACVPAPDWDAAMQSCEAALMQFPGTLCGGVDVLFAPGWKRHAVLEVNAFGDLLPGVEHEGESTYAAQLRTQYGVARGK